MLNIGARRAPVLMPALRGGPRLAPVGAHSAASSYRWLHSSNQLCQRVSRGRRNRTILKDAPREQAHAPPLASVGAKTAGRRDEEEQEEHYEEYEPHATEMYIDDAVSQHLVKVYTTLGTSVATAGAGTMLYMFTPVAAVVPPMFVALGSFVPLLWLSFKPPADTAQQHALMTTFALMCGYYSGPLIGHFAHVDPAVVMMAFGGSTAIFSGMTLMALKARSKSMLHLGGPLFGSLIALIAVQVGASFMDLEPATREMLRSGYLYGGLGLFSLFISYDTQAIIERARAGEREHVRDSMGLFINFMNVFKLLLQIIGGRRGD